MIDLKTRLRGIVTVINTPFDRNEAVDLDALSRHVEYAMHAGVQGFLVPAMASEVEALTDIERAAIVDRVVSVADGAVPVIGGASAREPAMRTEWAHRVLDLGCDAVLVAVPYHDDATWERDVRSLATTVEGPLMIQDWDAAGYGAPVALIARLFAELDRFVSIKIEVVPAGTKYSQVLAATDGEIHVAGGWAVMQMIEAFDRGVDTIMPTALHEIYLAIDRAYRSGDRDGARTLFDRLLPILAFSNQHLDISILFFKRLLYRQGIYPTDRCRSPRLALDAVHRRIADELIDRALAMMEELS